jgi:hypothetical protein
MDDAELLAAAMANPDVLWAVMLDRKVAGPWVCGGGGTSRRLSVHIDTNAYVYAPSAYNIVAHAAIGGDGRCYANVLGRQVYGATRQEAEQWADAELVKAGWLLAGKEVKGG